MTPVPVVPAAWFDAITPIDPPRFTDEHPGWCTRHYAPAIRLGGDGIGATLQLRTQVLTAIQQAASPRLGRGTLTAGTVTEFLAAHQADGRVEPDCCILGDEAVYLIWSKWMPGL
jgi:hypothetical protein